MDETNSWRHFVNWYICRVIRYFQELLTREVINNTCNSHAHVQSRYKPWGTCCCSIKIKNEEGDIDVSNITLKIDYIWTHISITKDTVIPQSPREKLYFIKWYGYDFCHHYVFLWVVRVRRLILMVRVRGSHRFAVNYNHMLLNIQQIEIARLRGENAEGEILGKIPSMWHTFYFYYNEFHVQRFLCK